MTNEVPPQDSNDATKNKEHENVCPISFKSKETNVSIETIYNEGIGIGTYTRTIIGGIYLLETMHPKWRKINNSAFKKKISCLWFTATNVTTLDYYKGDPYALVLDSLEEIIPKTKRSIFGINQFIKKLQKGGKLNGVFLKKILGNISLMM